MLEKLFGVLFSLVTGDVTPEQRKLLLEVGWRCLVGFQMAAAWGLLTFIGISGFTQAQETAAIRQEVKQLKDASALQARLGIVREIRLQTDSMCSTPNMQIRGAIMNTIDKLREDYRSVTGEGYPEVRCP